MKLAVEFEAGERKLSPDEVTHVLGQTAGDRSQPCNEACALGFRMIRLGERRQAVARDIRHDKFLKPRDREARS